MQPLDPATARVQRAAAARAEAWAQWLRGYGPWDLAIRLSLRAPDPPATAMRAAAHRWLARLEERHGAIPYVLVIERRPLVHAHGLLAAVGSGPLAATRLRATWPGPMHVQAAGRNQILYLGGKLDGGDIIVPDDLTKRVGRARRRHRSGR